MPDNPQDDPLLFGPRLLDEYESCRTQLGMSDGELAQVLWYRQVPYTTLSCPSIYRIHLDHVAHNLFFRYRL